MGVIFELPIFDKLRDLFRFTDYLIVGGTWLYFPDDDPKMADL